jgi:hypothetical protein
VRACPVGECMVCLGMLGRGDLSKDVPEVRYDLHGSGRDGCGGRYLGLSPDQAEALCTAVSDLVLLTQVWRARAEAEYADEPTSVDVLWHDSDEQCGYHAGGGLGVPSTCTCERE